MTTVKCPVVHYTATTGYLWWKKTVVDKQYYLLSGKWYDVETEERASLEMEAKLFAMFNTLKAHGLSGY